MIRLLLPAVSFLSIALCACTQSDTPVTPAIPIEPAATLTADLILTGGRVYTLAWDEPAPDGTPAANAPFDGARWTPDASAIAIRGGDIVFVGDDGQALKRRGADTRVIALNGATVIPGLVDSHTHVFELGAGLGRVRLTDVTNATDAIALVAERAQQVPPGEWIVGYGWDEGAWANHYPDKRALSAAVPEHPVYLRSLHGFGGWANQMALERAGITAATDVPVGGEMRLGADGEPNGLFLNNAVNLVADAIPAPDDQQLRRELTAALMQMAADGYVTVHEAGVNGRNMGILEALEKEQALPVRFYAMLSARDENLMRAWIKRGPDMDADSRLVTRSVKAYYDGALGSRGARLLEDYSDKPGHRGVSGDEYGFDETLVADAMAAGFQVGIHAIGDAGNRETLDYIERVYARAPSARASRHRIEHAQVLHPQDLPRLAKLDVIASMEPPHAVEDMPWAEDRVGPERIRGAYAWRSLRESGARLTFNADNPGSDHNIFYGLHAAVTRRDKNAQPADGWYPDEALTIEETLRAYTGWSAYAAFRETLTGKIAPQQWADLTVMDIDPFALATTDPAALLKGQVLMTIVAGQLVFDHKQVPGTD